MGKLARFGGRLVMLVAAFAAPACGLDGPASARTGAAVKAGQWGGAHILMTVAADHTDIEFDCGTASVAGTIDTDGAGAFSAAGTYQPERPGPTTPNGPPSRPMRLTGTVQGDDMQVRVVLTDQNEDVGTFALTFGASSRLVKCR